MSFETVAGATLGCTDAAAGTIYAPGTDVFSRIGEIIDLGDGYEGEEYNPVAHAPISNSQITQIKGGFRMPTIELTMAWDQSDSGQDLLRTAARTNAELTFELVKQGGDTRYFTAQVAEFIENIGTVDGVVNGAAMLLIQERLDWVYNDFWIRVFR
jgi:hypothetical protein